MSAELVLWQRPLFDVAPAPPHNRKLLQAQRRLQRLWRGDGNGDDASAPCEALAQLEANHFFVIDDFLTHTLQQRGGNVGVADEQQLDTLREDVQQRLLARRAELGGLTGGKRVAALRSDFSLWQRAGGGTRTREQQQHEKISTGSAGHLLDVLADSVDALVARLRDSTACEGDDAHAAESQLRHVRRRLDPMLAVYPANSSGYVRHMDNVCSQGVGRQCNGRRLTAVYYLNRDAPTRDGSSDASGGDGALRIFARGPPTSDPRVDLAPRMDRLVVFWSDERAPHAVLPTAPGQERLAVTFWYFDDTELAARHDGTGHRGDPPPLLRPMAGSVGGFSGGSHDSDPRELREVHETFAASLAQAAADETSCLGAPIPPWTHAFPALQHRFHACLASPAYATIRRRLRSNAEFWASDDHAPLVRCQLWDPDHTDRSRRAHHPPPATTILSSYAYFAAADRAGVLGTQVYETYARFHPELSNDERVRSLLQPHNDGGGSGGGSAWACQHRDETRAAEAGGMLVGCTHAANIPPCVADALGGAANRSSDADVRRAAPHRAVTLMLIEDKPMPPLSATGAEGAWLALPQVARVFATNPSLAGHPKQRALPLGVKEPSRWLAHLTNGLEAQRSQRTTLLECGGIGSSWRGRRAKLAALRANNWSCGGTYPPSDYIERMLRAKFVFSPRGHGMQSHRDYESWLAGAVPVMDEFPPEYEGLHTGLPMVVVPRRSTPGLGWEIVTPAFLQAEWERIVGVAQRGGYDMRRAYLPHWLGELTRDVW